MTAGPAARVGGPPLEVEGWGRRAARLAASRRVLGGLTALAAVALLVAEVQAQQGLRSADRSVVEAILAWSPLLLLGPPGQIGGFALNVLISFLAMAIGTVLGVALGLAQVAPARPVRTVAWAFTQFFRNSPWLVLLFFAMFLLPFEMRVGDTRLPFPDWLKATIGLSLPVMANIAELTRGAIQSIPSGQ